MGFTADLFEGIATDLAAAGVGVWRPTGFYAADEVGIVLNVVPSAPDAVIVLSGYSVSDDPTLSDTVQGVQVRTRAAGVDPRPTDDLADAIFDLWHGAADWEITGGFWVNFSQRTSWAPLGSDQSRRHERSDNYQFTVHRPSAHRT